MYSCTPQITLTDIVAELPNLHLLEATDILRVPQHVSQVTTVTVLHTYVWGIASGGVGEAFRKVLGLDQVGVVEALRQLELPVPSLYVLLREVEETTLLKDNAHLGGLQRGREGKREKEREREDESV